VRDAAEVAAAFLLITRFAGRDRSGAALRARTHAEQAIAHEARFFDAGYA